MFAAMGANPQQINWGEVYLALQSGVVDGQENPLANIYAAKLYEVQRFISFTNHKYEVTGLMMSRAAWGRLSESDRKLFQEAAADAGAYQRKAMAESEESLVAEFKKMPTIQMNSVDTAPFKKATEVVWDEWEKEAIWRLRPEASWSASITPAEHIQFAARRITVWWRAGRGGSGGWRTQLVSAAKYADALIEWGCKALLLVTGSRCLPCSAWVSCCATSFSLGFSFAPDLSRASLRHLCDGGNRSGGATWSTRRHAIAPQRSYPRYRIALAVLIHALTATVYFLLG